MSKSTTGERKENGLDELLAREEENYAIWYKNVSSGSFKTGFFATLGMMAPFEIKTTEGRKYFYNIYNNQKDYAKALIEATMPNIKT